MNDRDERTATALAAHVVRCGDRIVARIGERAQVCLGATDCNVYPMRGGEFVFTHVTRRDGRGCW